MVSTQHAMHSSVAIMRVLNRQPTVALCCTHSCTLTLTLLLPLLLPPPPLYRHRHCHRARVGPRSYLDFGMMVSHLLSLCWITYLMTCRTRRSLLAPTTHAHAHHATRHATHTTPSHDAHRDPSSRP
jgi:hypothetical protein